MIEFTTDGPFGKKVPGLFPTRVRIIGLGLTGTAVCDQLVLHSRNENEIWVVDSDQQGIEGSVVTQKLYIGSEFTRGLGCNGDFSLAREVVASEAIRLQKLTENCDYLILVVGLAGATGLAVAEMLAQYAQKAECKVVALGVQPFAFEGRNRKQQATQAIALLRRECDSVLVLSHDRLANEPTVRRNVRVGFHLMHQQLAKAVEAVAQVVCKRGLIQLSFADLRSLYGRYSNTEVLENCWISFVEGDVEDDCETLIHDLLEGPLLKDPDSWHQVDHAIVTVNGSRDISLADVQHLVNLLRESLPIAIPLSTSAHMEEPLSRRVGMTLLLAKTTTAPAIAPEDLYRPNYTEARPLKETQELPSWALPSKTNATPVPVPITPLVTVPEPNIPPAVTSPDTAKVEKGVESSAAGKPLKGKTKTPKPWKSALNEIPVFEFDNKAHSEAQPPLSPPPVLVPEPIDMSVFQGEPMSSSQEQVSPTPSETAEEDLLVSSLTIQEPKSSQDRQEASDSVPTPDFPFSSVPPTPRETTSPVETIAPAGAESPKRGKRARAKQEEIQFEPVSRGRFEKAYETIYRGEDLDLPTYRRRGLQVRV